MFEAALDSPEYTLASLALGPERRLWAHVDALMVMGPRRCKKLLLPVLDDPEAAPARAAAAALVLMELASVLLTTRAGRDPLASLRDLDKGPDPSELWERVLSARDAAEGEPRAGLQRALQLGASEPFVRWLFARIERGEGALAGDLELLALLDRAPTQLASYLSHDDPQVVRAAAVAARLSRAPEVLERLRPLAQAKDPLVSRAAVESALVHYIPGAWASALYWAFTDAPSPFRRRALLWVALLGDLEVHGWLMSGLEREDRRADTLWALGFCGRPAAVEAVLPWLEHEQYGPLAGEVVCAIAGLAPDAPGCWRRLEPSEDEALPPLARDTLDGDIVPKAEGALPLPNPAGVRAWWLRQRPSFEQQPRLSYLGGLPMHPTTLIGALRHGPLRRAHGLALELRIRSGGQLQLPTRSPTPLQHAAFDRLPSLELLELQRGLRRQ